MHKYLYPVPGDIGHPAEIVREGKEKEKIFPERAERDGQVRRYILLGIILT